MECQASSKSSTNVRISCDCCPDSLHLLLSTVDTATGTQHTFALQQLSRVITQPFHPQLQHAPLASSPLERTSPLKPTQYEVTVSMLNVNTSFQAQSCLCRPTTHGVDETKVCLLLLLKYCAPAMFRCLCIKGVQSLLHRLNPGLNHPLRDFWPVMRHLQQHNSMWWQLWASRTGLTAGEVQLTVNIAPDLHTSASSCKIFQEGRHLVIIPAADCVANAALH